MDCSCRGDQFHRRPHGGAACCVCACAGSGHAVRGAFHDTPNDPLLLALAARLLQSPSPRHYQFFAEEIHGFRSPPWERQQRDPYECQELPQQQTDTLVRSLHRRIAALEAIRPSNPAADPPAEVDHRKVYPRERPPPRRALLRDLAARTIQAAFRRFLVRRSRTLRDLKAIASVGSDLDALRLSFSGEKRIAPRLLNRQVADLLRRLESIQSVDALVCEGKGRVGRGLEQLVVYAESLLLRKAEEEIVVDSRRARGRVSGVEDLHDLSASPLGETEESDDAIGSLVSSISLEDDEGIQRTEVGGRISRAKPSSSGSPDLSAPLPLQMEPRRGNLKKSGAIMI